MKSRFGLWSIWTLLVALTAQAKTGDCLKVSFVNGTIGTVTAAADCNTVASNNASSDTRYFAVASSQLLLTDNTSSSWGITTFGDDVGGTGAAITLTDETIATVFPLAKVSGSPNGCPLQGNDNLTLTLNGLTVGRQYTFTALVGRGNAWGTDSGSTYSLSGCKLLSVEVLGCGSGVTATPQKDLSIVVSQCQSGKWALVAMTFAATTDAVTFTGAGSHGNLNAFALEDKGEAPRIMMWSSATSGAWATASNWDNYSEGADAEPILENLATAESDPLVITYDATIAPASLTCNATSTTYLLEGVADYTFNLLGNSVTVVGEVALSGTASDVDIIVSENATLRMNGTTAGSVDVLKGGTLAGTGTISGELLVYETAILDARSSTATAALSIQGTCHSVSCDLLSDVTLPADETVEEQLAIVTVKSPAVTERTCILTYGALSGIQFELEQGARGQLETTATALYYTPAVGYRFKVQ